MVINAVSEMAIALLLSPEVGVPQLNLRLIIPNMGIIVPILGILRSEHASYFHR